MNINSPEFIVKRKITRLTLKWCKKNLGINKKKKKAIKLNIRIKPLKEGKYIIYGNYYSDYNSIYIYGLKEITNENVVSIIIHEYTHYLQSNKKYWEYFKTYNYSTHPYEIEARENEAKYTDICYNEIKHLIN